MPAPTTRVEIPSLGVGGLPPRRTVASTKASLNFRSFRRGQKRQGLLAHQTAWVGDSLRTLRPSQLNLVAVSESPKRFASCEVWRRPGCGVGRAEGGRRTPAPNHRARRHTGRSDRRLARVRLCTHRDAFVFRGFRRSAWPVAGQWTGMAGELFTGQPRRRRRRRCTWRAGPARPWPGRISWWYAGQRERPLPARRGAAPPHPAPR